MSFTDREKARLFMIGVLALFTAAMSFSLRGAIAIDLETQVLTGIAGVNSASLVAKALATAFLGFACTLFFGSLLLIIIGMKWMALLAAAAFISGTIIVVAAGTLGGEFTVPGLNMGMFLTGVGWGATEAFVNPMTSALYPEEKTQRLNVVHAWWPAGLIAGGLLAVSLPSFGMDWRVLFMLSCLPAMFMILLVAFSRFPETESEALGVGFTEMIGEVFRKPSFFIWFGAMFLTASIELAPGQWVDFALSDKVGMRGILVLVYVSGLMFVLRHFAGSIEARLSQTGLLWVSSLLATAGLFLLSVANSPLTALAAATVWGAGVCFLWPTMLSVAATRYPRGGPWATGLMGTAGALAIYFVLPQLGVIYDRARIDALGNDVALTDLSADAQAAVNNAAAQTSFQTLAFLSVSLLVIFGALWLSEVRSRSNKNTSVEAKA